MLQLWSWGGNERGQLAIKDRTDTGRAIPQLVNSLRNKFAVREVSVGFRHAACVACDGSVFTWGDNECVPRARAVQCGTVQCVNVTNTQTVDTSTQQSTPASQTHNTPTGIRAAHSLRVFEFLAFTTTTTTPGLVSLGAVTHRRWPASRCLCAPAPTETHSKGGSNVSHVSE